MCYFHAPVNWRGEIIVLWKRLSRIKKRPVSEVTILWTVSENQCKCFWPGRSSGKRFLLPRLKCTSRNLLWYKPGHWADQILYISCVLKTTPYLGGGLLWMRTYTSSSHNLWTEELGFELRFSDSELCLVHWISVRCSSCWHAGTGPPYESDGPYYRPSRAFVGPDQDLFCRSEESAHSDTLSGGVKAMLYVLLLKTGC